MLDNLLTKMVKIYKNLRTKRINNKMPNKIPKINKRAAMIPNLHNKITINILLTIRLYKNMLKELKNVFLKVLIQLKEHTKYGDFTDTYFNMITHSNGWEPKLDPLLVIKHRSLMHGWMDNKIRKDWDSINYFPINSMIMLINLCSEIFSFQSWLLWKRM